MQEDDKLRVNLKHLVHYTLLWTVYIDNYYNIHKAPKKKFISTQLEYTGCLAN